MELSLGFSPCPNDTFIFYALLHHKIDTKGFSFHPVIEDVESLNRKALHVELDCTKLSFAVSFRVKENYQLLSSGAALGRGCGPLVISKRDVVKNEIQDCTVAIPGRLTTANLLFNYFFPQHGILEEMIFSEIENSVLNEKTDLGVIIHENRFTYEKKGLKKVADLGELWEQQTSLPIPLGGIFLKHSFDATKAKIISSIIRKSVEYAWANTDEVIEYVKNYSQEMDEDVMWQHIRLYVNDFTLDIGDEGKSAIEYFYNTNSFNNR